jgi:hypothetical protein
VSSCPASLGNFEKNKKMKTKPIPRQKCKSITTEEPCMETPPHHCFFTLPERLSSAAKGESVCTGLSAQSKGLTKPR